MSLFTYILVFLQELQYSLLSSSIMAQVYTDAPHAATGPAQDDVTPFFSGPYYEWWNVTMVGTLN